MASYLAIAVSRVLVSLVAPKAKHMRNKITPLSRYERATGLRARRGRHTPRALTHTLPYEVSHARDIAVKADIRWGQVPWGVHGVAASQKHAA